MENYQTTAKKTQIRKVAFHRFFVLETSNTENTLTKCWYVTHVWRNYQL